MVNVLQGRYLMMPTDAPAPGPTPELLAKAIAARDERPWNFYQFERDDYKKWLNRLADQVADLSARLASLTEELEGDGTHGPDVRKSLGLRAIVELDAENMALLKAENTALSARLAVAEQEKVIEREWHEHYRDRCRKAEDAVADLTALVAKLTKERTVCQTCQGRTWVTRAESRDLGNGLGSGGIWNEPCPSCNPPQEPTR